MLDTGDRALVVERPPLHVAPSTVGLLDTSTSTYWSAECWSAPFPAAPAVLDDAHVDEWRDAFVRFHHWHCPWVHAVDPAWWRRAVDRIAQRNLAAIVPARRTGAARTARGDGRRGPARAADAAARAERRRLACWRSTARQASWPWCRRGEQTHREAACSSGSSGPSRRSTTTGAASTSAARSRAPCWPCCSSPVTGSCRWRRSSTGCGRRASRRRRPARCRATCPACGAPCARPRPPTGSGAWCSSPVATASA